MSKEEGDVEKSADSDGYHAPNASDGQWDEKWIFHHGRRMFWHGSLNGTPLMEQGGVHACTWPYYFSGISVPQKNCGRPPMYPSEFICKGMKMHYASDGPKESWQHRLGCQRRRCNVGLLIRLFEFIATL